MIVSEAFQNIDVLNEFPDNDLHRLFERIQADATDYIGSHDTGASPLLVIDKSLPASALGPVGLVKDAVDAAAKTPYLSVDEGFPSAVDHVAADSTQAFLQTVQANRIGGPDGLAGREDQFRIGAELFSGPHHDQLNLLLNISGRIEDPAMREGKFEAILELQTAQAADKAANASPLLGYMERLHTGDVRGVAADDSVAKLERLMEVAQSSGHYNPTRVNGGRLFHDEAGQVVRDLDVAYAGGTGHLEMNRDARLTEDGRLTLSLGDGLRQLRNDIDVADMYGEYDDPAAPPGLSGAGRYLRSAAGEGEMTDMVRNTFRADTHTLSVPETIREQPASIRSIELLKGFVEAAEGAGVETSRVEHGFGSAVEHDRLQKIGAQHAADALAADVVEDDYAYDY